MADIECHGVTAVGGRYGLTTTESWSTVSNIFWQKVRSYLREEWTGNFSVTIIGPVNLNLSDNKGLNNQK